MSDPLYPLGRLPAADSRDRAFRFASLLPPAPTRTNRYWWSDWFGNQGAQSSCVGFSWTHWLNAGPITQSRRDWDTYARSTYRDAQLIDEWPGQEPDYEGTSVRAGAKALQSAGFITEYRWAWTANEIVRAVLDVGPVVVGTVWTEAMFTPVNGRITPTGEIVGGHAYLIDGANTLLGTVRIKNSWGRGYGNRGRTSMTIADLSILMALDGEAVLATEARA